MTSARRERDLFFAALDLPEGEARETFLARACGADRDLLAGVEALLACHGREDARLDEPLAERLAAGAACPADPAPAAAADEQAATSMFAAPAVPGDLGSLGATRIVGTLPPAPFGPVFSGIAARSGAAVTVRCLAPHFAAAPSIRGRFLRLARGLAGVRHDAIPTIHLVGEEPLPHVVVADVGGSSLDALLRAGAYFAPREAAALAARIAAGLAAAHERGIVHRSLAPGNVVVGAGDRPPVWLVDVGLARSVDDEAGPGADPPGRSDAFLAPEQVLGDRLDPLDHRPDLFALGCLLAALVTGRSPFAAATPEATLRRLAEADPLPGVLELLPGALLEIARDLLHADPARRPDSAGAVWPRLAAIAVG